MKKNKNLIRYLIVLLFILNNTLGNAQILEKELQTYKHQLIDSLKSFEEIYGDLDSLYVEYNNKVYSYNLLSVKKGGIMFFEIGTTSSHNRKYLAILYKKQLIIYKTKDFLNDFSGICMYINYIPESSGKIISILTLLGKISEMYKYNISPPWEKKFFN
jgi:hypothetical protein